MRLSRRQYKHHKKTAHCRSQSASVRITKEWTIEDEEGNQWTYIAYNKGDVMKAVKAGKIPFFGRKSALKIFIDDAL